MGLTPQKTLLKKDWKEDHIYLVQFPRCGSIVSTSPFAIKLETWLRFTKLPYTNISNELTIGSAKGQIPFIELNGQQYADSQAVIEMLIEKYKVPIDNELNDRQKAEVRALKVMIEESLQRVAVYDRSQDNSWFASPDGFIENVQGVKKYAFQYFINGQVRKQLRDMLYAQGMGRNSPAEVDEIAKKDLNVLSTWLGDKNYLYGDRPTTIDATLFGTLVSLYDPPLNSKVIKPYMESSTPNLVAFIKRVKQEFWPDYEKLCKELLMNSTDAKPPTE
ncbi:hypothetical protein M3Y94_00269400 [Aphelenchoides besseyi]|nr:hypothetical protein M3Y94_00269400 [Aphelenchoides besseyi]